MSPLCFFFAICASVMTPRAANDGLPYWQETAVYAVPIVMRWEGLKTEAYLDTIARPPVWTICYGETYNVRPGEVRTRAQCEEGLRRGLKRFWADYRAGVQPEKLRGLLRPQTDAALTSLTWNIGAGAILRSTALRRLNAGDIAGACEAATWFNKAGGRIIRGLQNRRSDEYRLCMEGVR